MDITQLIKKEVANMKKGLKYAAIGVAIATVFIGGFLAYCVYGDYPEDDYLLK